MAFCEQALTSNPDWSLAQNSDDDIPYFVPDMPCAEQLLPYLRQIDRNGWYSNFGPLTAAFQNKVAKLLFSLPVEPRRLILTASGTSALELGLRSLNLCQNSRVLIPTLTFPATAAVVIRCGYTPVLAPVDEACWMLTPTIARELAESNRIDAVIPVAACGAPLPVESWSAFQRDTGIAVVFDAAAALGNQQVSTDIPVAFSMHATKPMGIGEGGMLCMPDADSALAMSAQTNFGYSQGVIETVGTNAKMSEYHAAVGLAQLSRIGAVFSALRERYSLYLSILESSVQLRVVQVQAVAEGVVPSGFAVRLPQADVPKLLKRFAEQKVSCRRLYGAPLSWHPGIMSSALIGAGSSRFGVEEEIIALPYHTSLRNDEIQKVAAILAHGAVLRTPRCRVEQQDAEGPLV